jgi:hypothetical protein
VRILAFGLLVFYHVGMYYVSWDWHVKSPHAGPTLEPLMLLTSPWRMSLLFVVSGVATACIFRSREASVPIHVSPPFRTMGSQWRVPGGRGG